MIIQDLVLGNVKITDKRFTSIIKHPVFKRLKNIHISTYGYLFELKRSSTRYEHSLGDFLLLRKYGATEEEQFAGLIHDISHTAFSHLSTYALQGKYPDKELHEIIKEKFLIDSGLKEIIIANGFDFNKVIETENYSLAENQLPDLCADRLDYTMRDALHLQILSRQQVNKILEGLIVHENEFIFNNAESAFYYCFAFFLLNLQHYGSATEAHFNNDFGNLIKRAMEKGILEENDWFTDDIKVIRKLKQSKDKEIKDWIKSYNSGLVVYEDTENPDKIFPKKIRIIDPKVLLNGEIKRLTEINTAYKFILDDYRKTHQKHELPIKIFRKNVA